jgi:non-homologous end joining protein Ku
MEVYEVVVQEGKMSSEQTHYFVAKDFDDAYQKALKYLVKAKKDYEDAWIESIAFQYEVEVIK